MTAQSTTGAKGSTCAKQLSFWALVWTWRKHGDPFIHHYFEGLRVLDVGCGLGGFLKRRPHDFIGLDLSVEMVAECQRQGLHAFVGSAISLPFPDDSIEAINCDNIIEHLQPAQAAAMLNEFARVLQPGGVALIRSPLGEAVWNTFSHVRPYPPGAIEKLLRTETEAFVRPQDSHLKRLKIGHAYYFGRYSTNRAFYLLATAWAWFIPWARKQSYVLALFKEYSIGPP